MPYRGSLQRLLMILFVGVLAELAQGPAGRLGRDVRVYPLVTAISLCRRICLAMRGGTSSAASSDPQVRRVSWSRGRHRLSSVPHGRIAVPRWACVPLWFSNRP